MGGQTWGRGGADGVADGMGEERPSVYRHHELLARAEDSNQAGACP